MEELENGSIRANDVLCGRGESINQHEGNKQFRRLVEKQENDYYAARLKMVKRALAKAVVSEIRSLEPAGRFLAKDKETNKWYDIGDERATDKTLQLFREHVNKIRKEEQAREDWMRKHFERHKRASKQNHGANMSADLSESAACSVKKRKTGMWIDNENGVQRSQQRLTSEPQTMPRPSVPMPWNCRHPVPPTRHERSLPHPTQPMRRQVRSLPPYSHTIPPVHAMQTYPLRFQPWECRQPPIEGCRGQTLKPNASVPVYNTLPASSRRIEQQDHVPSNTIMPSSFAARLASMQVPSSLPLRKRTVVDKSLLLPKLTVGLDKNKVKLLLPDLLSEKAKALNEPL